MELAEEVVVVRRQPSPRLVEREVLDVHLDERVVHLQPLEHAPLRLVHAIDDIVGLQLTAGRQPFDGLRLRGRRSGDERGKQNRHLRDSHWSPL